ncbi:hypothetical protein IE81DRAFT_303858 [Ceraceosorus guamensis]|uniref:separase n=1 Tax=Ceraceosorus guamensis TaxID=1522189 RepID=A0A316W0W5_9BASI|nr:hypothetical protein IE81DRAFT_303858 [Ceraceosorus guamensis]PWN41315.1 hypothetical protein IE81DRAFT_303858 [Ceraceosorus guamensis]
MPVAKTPAASAGSSSRSNGRAVQSSSSSKLLPPSRKVSGALDAPRSISSSKPKLASGVAPTTGKAASAATVRPAAMRDVGAVAFGASHSQEVHCIDGEEVLSRLSIASSITGDLVLALEGLFGVAGPSSAGLAKVVAKSSATCTALHMVGKEKQEMTKMQKAHLAKRIANACLKSLNDLVVAGWKPAREQASQVRSDKKGASARSAAPRSAHTSTMQRPRDAPRTCSGTTPASGMVTSKHVADLLKCCGSALTFLSREVQPAGKGTEFLSARCTAIRKMVSLELGELIGDEVAALRRELLVSCGLADSDAHAERTVRDRTVLFPSPGNVPREIQPFILDTLTLSAAGALQTLPASDLEAYLEVLREPEGVLAWLRAAAEDPTSKSCADRPAFALERGLRASLSRLEHVLNPASGVNFEARSVGMEALLCVSDLKTDVFLATAARVGAAHYQACTDEARPHAFARMDAAFTKWLNRLGPEVLSSQGFVKFAEVWLNYARHARDCPAVDRIARLLTGSDSDSCTDDPKQYNRKDSASADLHIARSVAVITKAVVAFDTAGETLPEAALLDGARACLDDLGSTSLHASDDGREQLFTSLGRLCRRMLDAMSASLVDNALSELVKSYMRVTSRHLRTPGGPPLTRGTSVEDILHDTCDAGRFLATSVLKPSISSTHDEARQSLSQVDGLCALESLALEAQAKQAYNVSTTWYQLGVKLYHERLAGAAVLFLEKSCEAGELSERLFADSPADDMSDKRADAAVRRYDVLSSSLRLAQQHARAVDISIKAIRAVRPARWGMLAEATHTSALCDIFANPALLQLANIVTSFQHVSTFSLLRSQCAKAPHGVLRVLEDAAVPETAIGVLLEQCSKTLEPLAHRAEAPNALMDTLQSALEVYGPTTYPLRRARVLLRQLESCVLLGNRTYEDVEESRLEAQTLLDCEALGADAKLVGCVPALRAQLALLMLCASQKASGALGIERTGKYAHEAAMCLRNLVPSASTKTGQEPEKRILKDSLSRQDNVALRTPPRRKPMALPPTPPTMTTATTNQTSGTDVLDKERLGSLLNLAARMTVASGHSLACLELLSASWQLYDTDTLDTHAVGDKTLCGADLAEEMMRLGLHTEAQEILRSADATTAGPLARFSLFLVRAKDCIRREDLQEAVQMYEKAVAAAGLIEASPPKSSSWTMALERAASNLRHAQAAEVYSLIRQAQGDATSALQAAVEGVRCSARAVSIMTKICTPPKISKTDDEARDIAQLLGPPASIDGKKVAGAESSGSSEQSGQQPTHVSVGTHAVASLYWRVVHCASTAYSHASTLYDLRGSAKDAEMFATETINFCKPLGVPVSSASALIQRARIRAALAQTFVARDDLQQAHLLLDGSLLPETCALAIAEATVRGENGRTTDLLEIAKVSTESEALVQLVKQLRVVGPAPQADQQRRPTAAKRQVAAPTKSKSAPLKKISSPAVPTQLSTDFPLLRLKMDVLAHHVEALLDFDRLQEASDKLDRLHQLEQHGDSSLTSKVAFADAKVAVRRALQQLQGDQVLSMISETVISFTDAADANAREPPHLAKSVAALFLEQASSLSASLLSLSTARAFLVRRVLSLLTDLFGLAAVLLHGGQGDESVGKIAQTTNAASAVTLGRELMEAIEMKLKRQVPMVGANSPEWLRFAGPSAAQRAPRTRPALRAGRAAALMDEDDHQASSSDDESDSEVQAAINPSRKNVLTDQQLQSYWESVKHRHATCAAQIVKADAATRIDLPPHWTVITINLSHDGSSLVVSRQRGPAAQAHANDVAFRLPIDRHGRREGEEEELSMAAALAELKDVVDTSNRATQGAKNLQGVDARRQWWQNRMQLDIRIKDLVEAIEQRWLGPFKSIFLESTAQADELASLRTAWDGIFRRACFGASGSKRAARVQVPEAILDCLSALPPACTDEELEDLLHFVIDSFQFSSVPVAVDEVDFDHTVVQLRGALETFRGKVSARTRGSGVDAHALPAAHTFLVLDKDTCALPWESMPCIRGRAVSRIPSLSFLQDRIELSRLAQPKSREDEGGSFNLGQKPSAYYLLNPSGELTRTQERFEPWLKSRKWAGDAGHVPVADAFSASLASKDLVLYFGHSGAEQFARSQAIRSLKRCAVTMLWGCSSGVLRDQGEYDRAGTPYNYMLAGCPALVANLWDATDRELDGVAESVFVKCGLMRSTDVLSIGVEPRSDTSNSSGNSKLSLTQAVNASRDACKLPYLTGAAVVVYGVPVYF